ncbi:unnamed protein product, partial [Effrenium voratum]
RALLRGHGGAAGGGRAAVPLHRRGGHRAHQGLLPGANGQRGLPLVRDVVPRR